MCFVCFCVFFGKSGSDQVTTPMCFMCFCVFFNQCKKKADPCVLCVFVFFGWKFRPSHTTHVFDVFLCFLIPGGYGVRHVFCVFLCFLANLV